MISTELIREIKSRISGLHNAKIWVGFNYSLENLDYDLGTVLELVEDEQEALEQEIENYSYDMRDY